MGCFNTGAGYWPTQTVAGTITVTPPATQTVTGTVTVSAFPAAQTVTGTVGILSFPATQTVAGAVSVSAFPAPTTVKLLSVVTGVTVVKASAGTLFGFSLSLGAAGFLHVYNAVTATAASTAITAVFPQAAGVNNFSLGPQGMLSCATGITIGIFTTYNGSTAATTTGSIIYL